LLYKTKDLVTDLDIILYL